MRSDRAGPARKAVANTTGAPYRETVVHGGDTAATFRVELVSGDVLFAKTHNRRRPRLSSSATDWGLEWLRSSDGSRAPCCRHGRRTRKLAMETAASRSNGWSREEWRRRRGGLRRRELALLHGSDVPCFGRVDGRTTGAWPAERTERDVGGFVAAAERAAGAHRPRAGRRSPSDTIDQLERLAATLERFDDG